MPLYRRFPKRGFSHATWDTKDVIVNVGDLLGHIPLPAKITIEVLPSIDLREQFGPEPDPDEVYRYVTGLMQEALDGLAAERRFPVIG